MTYDGGYRFAQALDPSALATIRADAWFTTKPIASSRCSAPTPRSRRSPRRSAVAAPPSRPVQALGLRRNSARNWSQFEDKLLVERYGIDATARIVGALGRGCAATYARAGWLGLTEAASPPWTPWEDAQLRAGYAGGVAPAPLATLFGRPVGGVVARAAALALRHPHHPPGWTQARRRSRWTWLSPGWPMP